jgi:hypothetical protein
VRNYGDQRCLADSVSGRDSDAQRLESLLPSMHTATAAFSAQMLSNDAQDVDLPIVRAFMFFEEGARRAPWPGVSHMGERV